MVDSIHIDLVGNLNDKVRALPEIISLTEGAVEQIAAAARDLAPVDEGDYLDGIVVQKTQFGGRVLASDQKSAWIEFGIPSRGIPAQFILRRAVDAVGLKFTRKSGRE